MTNKEYQIDLDGFSGWLQNDKSLSPRTVTSYNNIMSTYNRQFDGVFSALNNREVEESAIECGKSKNTINNNISAINKYIEYLQSKGEQDLEDWKMTRQRIRSVQFLDDILSMPDYEFLLKKALANEKYDVYLYARIAGTTGMRLCEMLQIKREHIEFGYVDIYGKGAKKRRIYFPKNMRADCLHLLDLLGLKSGYVFSPRFSGEQPFAAYGRGIQKKLASFGEECELPKGLVHPHGFRHFFAKEFVRKNPNISLLADLLGHSNLNTTRIYLKLTSKEQAEVVDETVTW